MRTAGGIAAWMASLAAAAAIGCAGDDPAPAPAPITCGVGTPTGFEAFDAASATIYIDGDDPAPSIVQTDAADYLARLWNIAAPSVRTGAPDGTSPLSIWLSTSPEGAAAADDPADGGYTLRRIDDGATTTLLVYAASPDDLSFGTYALLEELGARFFHPFEELVPAFPGPRVPTSLDVTRRPAFATRGLHLHLLHPIEYFDAFNGSGDAALAEAKRVVDWLVKTGQNQVQWYLIGDLDDAWRDHATKIIEYAHARGVRAGAVVQLWGGSSLQNSYALVEDEEAWEAEIFTTPRRVQYEEILALSADERATFEADVIEALDAFASEVEAVVTSLSPACDNPDPTMTPWCREVVDGAAVIGLRARHAAALSRAVVDYAAGGDAHADHRAEATLAREAAAGIIARRETAYRVDAARLVEPQVNPTIYKFGYLRQAHTQCYWHRQEEQVTAIVETGGPSIIALLPTCLD